MYAIRWGCSLYEIMPQNSSRILVYANICGDVDRIILYHWPAFVFPLRGEQLPYLCESCKAPVTFLGVESMICSYSNTSARMSSHAPDRPPTVVCVYCRVMLVPQNEGKLCASVPALHRLHASVLITLLEIEGGKVDVISVWEKQYPPNMSSTVSSFHVQERLR